MLEKPDLQDAQIVACLLNEYGRRVDDIAFLPLGADPNAAVYRAVLENRTPYFVKLRRGAFDETSVALPKYLSDQGIKEIIPPVATRTGHLCASLETFTLILYRYVEGQDGYAVSLTDEQWRGLGAAVKRIHTTAVPPGLTSRIARETYSAEARETTRAFLATIEDRIFENSAGKNLAALLRVKRDEILDLVARAERLARALEASTPEFVVCHSDIHAGNILIGAGGALHIVDWDNPIQAPKERDLMFVGGAQGFTGHTAQEEETLFYAGYGPTVIDPFALAYYRYERIVQDIAVYCEQIFVTDGAADRDQSLRQLSANFLPNGTIEIAYRSDKTGWSHRDQREM